MKFNCTVLISSCYYWAYFYFITWNLCNIGDRLNGKIAIIHGVQSAIADREILTIPNKIVAKIKILSENRNYCPYDAIPLNISWQKISSDDSKHVLMGLYNDDDLLTPRYQFNLSHMTFSSTQKKNTAETISPLKKVKPALECYLNGPYCTISIESVSIHNSSNSSHKSKILNSTIIIVNFTQDSAMPACSTKEDIDSFLIPNHNIGNNYTGAWISRRSLQIMINESIREKVKDSAISFDLVMKHGHLNIKDMSPKVIQTQVNVRLKELGSFVFQVFTTNQYDIIAISDKIKVKECTNFILLENLSPSKQLPVSPSFKMNGLAAMTGSHGFRLPHKSLPNQEDGSWSLMFWIYLDEDSKGSHRTLFYKGPGHNHRTPSAWIQAQNRRLFIQVSTVANLEVASESNQELPLRKWTHLTFVFHNCSTSDTADSHFRQDCEYHGLRKWYYLTSYYVNGKLDQAATFYSPVLPNKGPLYIGKDPWFNGFEGFIGLLALFGSTLDQDEIQYEYQSQKRSFFNHQDGWKDFESLYPSSLLIDGSNTHSDKKISSQALSSMKVMSNTLYEKAEEMFQKCDFDSSRLFELYDAASKEGHTDAAYKAGMILLGLLESESCIDEDLPTTAHSILPIEWSSMHRNIETSSFGKGSKNRNATLAKEYFQNAAHHGHSKAMLMLALMYSSGIGIKLKDHDESNDVCLENTCMRPDIKKNTMVLGLYHHAAAKAEAEAWVVLGNRYYEGDGINKDLEAAAYYYHLAADVACSYFHEKGKQPNHEMHKLSYSNEDSIELGQRGDEDELIQYQMLRADQGHVPSMVAMGDLYYWGGRGLPRDHVRAFHYFSTAGSLGDMGGLVAAAGMLLKGEGVKQDNVTALKWYENAADNGNTRALNGLGYIFFYGNSAPKNLTKAVEYFETAAALNSEGDSSFNAGHCYHNGLGVEKNLTTARTYYEKATRHFGHIDAALALGKMYLFGEGVDRSVDKSLEYLKPVVQMGPWGSSVRKGFDKYLSRDYNGATIRYYQAIEYGYAIAHSNIAFMYDKGYSDALAISGKDNLSKMELKQLHAFQHYMKAAENNDAEAFVRIGDYYFYGYGGLKCDYEMAIWWYSRASSYGIAQASYNVGVMHEYALGVPLNFDRSRRYYELILQNSPTIETKVVVYLALIRLTLREWAYFFFAYSVEEFKSTNMSAANLQLLREIQFPSWIKASFEINEIVNQHPIMLHLLDSEIILILGCTAAFLLLLCIKIVRKQRME